MSTPPIRVTLIEDHTLVAQSLALALVDEGLQLTTLAPKGTDEAIALLPAITAARPDVVLLDLDLGAAGDGATLIAPLQRAGIAVVVVTGAMQPLRWGECLARGARSVLPKSAPLDAIAATVRAAAAGGQVMAPGQRDELVRRWQDSQRVSHGVHDRFDRLSRREAEVLAALMDGQRVRDIAAAAVVAEATVRSQVKSILAKLGVTSQIAALAMARDAGWKPVPKVGDIGG